MDVTYGIRRPSGITPSHILLQKTTFDFQEATHCGCCICREGQPGAAVVAGGRSSTRENRLLSWAEEIESIVAVQRTEMRQTRMELAGAQEVRCSGSIPMRPGLSPCSQPVVFGYVHGEMLGTCQVVADICTLFTRSSLLKIKLCACLAHCSF